MIEAKSLLQKAINIEKILFRFFRIKEYLSAPMIEKQ